VHTSHPGHNGTAILASTDNGSPALIASAFKKDGHQPVTILATEGHGYALDASSRLGVAARFIGASAAVQLFPHKHAGHPTHGHHEQGELLVDADGRLWLCTKTGTPGTWRRLAFA